MTDFVRLARLIAPYRFWLVLGGLLALLTALSIVGLLALSTWFVTAMAMAGVAGAIMNYVTPSAGVRAFALMRSGGRYLERVTTHDAAFRVLGWLRLRLYQNIEPLSPADMGQDGSADTVSRMSAEVDTLADFYIRVLVPVFVAIAGAVAAALFLLRYSALLAAVDATFLAIAGLFLPLLVGALGRGPGEQAVKTAAKLRAALVDSLQGLAEITLAGAEEEYRARVARLSGELLQRQRQLGDLSALATAALVFLPAAGLAAGAAAWGYLAGSGKLVQIDAPTIAMLVFASFECVAPLPDAFHRLGQIRASARRVFALLDAGPPMAEAPSVAPLADQPAAASVAPPPAGGAEVSFREVSLRYEADRPPALERISFSVASGERLGVVGASGAGKSSIINLLARFWEPESGSISLNGQDLRSCSPEQARTLFSVSPQVPFLFNTTIRENLLLGNQEATSEAVRLSLEAAQLGEMIDRLPSGLETQVGESGLMLSAGEARRLCVARTLLSGAPLLLLDEPTEDLDALTADSMMRAVARAAGGRTLILITHRLAALGAVDRVLVLERGRIVEQGAVAALRSSGKLFRQLMDLEG